MMRSMLVLTVVAVFTGVSLADDARFSKPPAAIRQGDGMTISFALAGATDVEVAVVDRAGKVVRHLAAGVVGGEAAPPPPLKPGLEQQIVWDGKDDGGNPAKADGMTIRVRAGTGVKFGRLLGSHPFSMGRITGVAADAAGNAYVMTVSGGTGNFKQIIMLDPDANYVRTVLPFPADLPAERVTGWARHDGSPRPKNHNGLGPEFYTLAHLTLLKSVSSQGLVLTDGKQIYMIAVDGGMVGESFSHGNLWGKKALPNTGGGPTHLTASPDGKYLYLAGPYSSNTAYGHKADADFPPGRVYRMEIGTGVMEPFVTLSTIGHNPAKSGQGWNSKHISHPGNYTVPHGPIHAVAVDGDGNVLVADQDGQAVAVFDKTGKELNRIPTSYPDELAVHPQTGSIYVLTKQIVGYQKFRKRLLKYDSAKSGKLVAELDLGQPDKFSMPTMTLAAGGGKATIWLSGVAGGVVRIRDKGDSFEVDGDLSDKTRGSLYNADRIEVDRETDAVYINNAWSEYRVFNGLTGAGGDVLKLDGGASATDLAVGPGGFIYAQLGPGYSGPLLRYDRNGKPAPFDSLGTHELSGYVYGRYHGNGGNCEKGMCVSREGILYMNWMFGGWVRYALSAWGPDGRPINGDYVVVDPGHAKQGTPAELRKAIIGPLPCANAGVRTDSKGRIYVGVGVHPKGFAPPAGYEKDHGYIRTTGSIVRFSKSGGAWSAVKGSKQMALDKETVWFNPGPVPENALEMNGGNYFVGADACYDDYGPMSGGHADVGGIGDPGFCVCRCARFDIDGFDRLYIPNAATNSVRIVDNAGNLVCRFGSYGNFDSQGPMSAKPSPAIPLGWPVGAAVSDGGRVYVSDMLNRRVVRVDLTWQTEEICEVK